MFEENVEFIETSSSPATPASTTASTPTTTSSTAHVPSSTSSSASATTSSTTAACPTSIEVCSILFNSGCSSFSSSKINYGCARTPTVIHHGQFQARDLSALSKKIPNFVFGSLPWKSTNVNLGIVFFSKVLTLVVSPVVLGGDDCVRFSLLRFIGASSSLSLLSLELLLLSCFLDSFFLGASFFFAASFFLGASFFAATFFFAASFVFLGGAFSTSLSLSLLDDSSFFTCFFLGATLALASESLLSLLLLEEPFFLAMGLVFTFLSSSDDEPEEEEEDAIVFVDFEWREKKISW
eukprot:CCRYP_005094-RB/>CCRYP_005094-RB protein AED:0.39 eAED:1.00 QI:0/0/0/1/0/0/4/0/294